LKNQSKRAESLLIAKNENMFMKEHFEKEQQEYCLLEQEMKK
jgi:hypothetical protein